MLQNILCPKTKLAGNSEKINYILCPKHTATIQQNYRLFKNVVAHALIELSWNGA